MDLTGKLIDLSCSYDGKLKVAFELNRTAATRDINTLKINDNYKLKVKEHNSRSLPQNDLFWAIVGEIDEKQNAIRTEDGRWEIYLLALESAGVDYDDYVIPRNAVSIIKKGCRTSKILHDYGDTVAIRCFSGSSSFNKKEMGELIDWALRYAFECGVVIIDYKLQYLEIYG